MSSWRSNAKRCWTSGDGLQLGGDHALRERDPGPQHGLVVGKRVYIRGEPAAGGGGLGCTGSDVT